MPPPPQMATQSLMYEALVPALGVGALVAAVMSNRLPESASSGIRRLLASDLTALFCTVVYGHYIWNVEAPYAIMDDHQKFSEAAIRVGVFVLAIALARRHLDQHHQA